MLQTKQQQVNPVNPEISLNKKWKINATNQGKDVNVINTNICSQTETWLQEIPSCDI